MSYILLVDDEPDIADMLSIVVSSSCSFPAEVSASGKQALELMKVKGAPKLIVCDYKVPDVDGAFLFKQVKDLYPGVPFVVCSGNPIDQLQQLLPMCAAYIQKPNMMKPLKEYLQTHFPKVEKKEEYVQIPLGFLKRIGVINFDTFVRLNDEKYIKVHQTGDVLDKDDLEKIEKKYLDKLFLTKEDSHVVVKEFEDYLTHRLFEADDSKSKDESYNMSQALQTTALICKSLGWSEESLNLAKKTVDGTLKFIKRNKSWKKNLRLPDGDDFYSTHISQLAVLTCLVANNIGWFSESTQEKLVMAALLHDHFVDETSYANIELLKSEINANGVKSKYALHPFQAAELSRSLKGVPTNVDTIIMEHHERPNGDGFPRGLSASRISALGALFIICEELIIFFSERSEGDLSLDDFFDAHPEFLLKDPFKKIANSMKSGV